MAYPTCDHTMHSLTQQWWHCPRCGTLKAKDELYWPDLDIPLLVQRARDYLDDPNDLAALALGESVGRLEQVRSSIFSQSQEEPKR